LAGITGAQARWRAAEGLIPVHRLKGRNLVVAFKSEIAAHARGLASQSRKVSEASTVTSPVAEQFEVKKQQWTKKAKIS
jgi:hypothetical protein